jgi:MFS family permease
MKYTKDNLFARLQPWEQITPAATQYGLKMLIWDAICFQVMTVLTSGAFLVAFALQLGASNVIIGALAALNPLAQILQIPAIFLIEATGLRKAAVVLSSFGSRLFWFVVALTPWLLPKTWQIQVFLSAVLLFFAIGSISNLAFSSWMRDFIPAEILGDYFGKRSAIATALGAGVGLIAGISVDVLKRYMSETGIYSGYFLFACAVGLAGVYFLTRIPEPRMVKAPSQGLWTILKDPFRDHNFRQLLVFLGAWNFAVNLAVPFFTVYMLRRLQFGITLVLSLSVLSQFINVFFFQLWGRLADRFSNKSALMQACPLFLLSIILFPFTNMPQPSLLTLPLLLLIHILAGVSNAGILLCTSNIALKMAPPGKATSYLATNALVSGLAATIAPLLGGFAADWFARQELILVLKWASEPVTQAVEFQAMTLRGLDFLFLFAFGLGLYSLHRLTLVKEVGEVEEDIVLLEFDKVIRQAIRQISDIAGIRYLFSFPYSKLIELLMDDDMNQYDSEFPASPGLFHPDTLKKQIGLTDEQKRNKPRSL